MIADIEQTMGYTGEPEAFLRVTCGVLCETAWFPIGDKVSDQMVDKIIATINAQAADEIERLRGEVAELTEDNTTLYNQCEDAIVRAEKAEDEIERLRRVEQQHNNLRTAAANLILYLEFGSDHREMLSKLKAALEEK